MGSAIGLAIGLSIPAAHARDMKPVPDSIAQRALACTACHGEQGRATSEGFFPRIAGKPEGYLYNQLINFREGRRSSAPMTYMVAYLSDDYLKEIAQYFSNLRLSYPPSQATDLPPSSLEQGRRLVTSGDPARHIPACASCHGPRLTGALPSIPSLVGLPRDYLNAQFGSWRNGTRHAATPDCMAQISRQLRPEEISAVSAWLASQPIPSDMEAAPAGTVKLPIACGSFPQ